MKHGFVIEPELKSKSMQWKGKGLPRTAEFRHQQTKVKQMVIFAYYHKGVLVCDRVTPKTNLDGDQYAYSLRKKLHPQIRKLRPGILILQENT